MGFELSQVSLFLLVFQDLLLTSEAVSLGNFFVRIATAARH
jgi:hypothetical protein